jgi:protein-tyrosine phosphatase
MMAEGIMRTRWTQQVGQGLVVSSMGVHGMDKLPPTELAIQVCADSGIDISRQRSRPLVPEELKQADLILVMEPFQKEFLKLFYPFLDDLIFMLGSWPERTDSRKAIVKDPVGGTLKDYQKAFKTLSDHVERIIPQLRNEFGY